MDPVEAATPATSVKPPGEDTIANKIKEIDNLLNIENHNPDLNETISDALTSSINEKLHSLLFDIMLIFNQDPTKSAKLVNGETYLHLAVKTGFITLVELFLRYMKINALNNLKYTPLHVAVINDEYEIVEFLLGKKAKVNTQNAHGVTPLQDAVRNGDVRMVKLLLNHGANPNYRITEYSPIHQIISRGSYESIAKALKVNSMKFGNWTETALHMVLEHNENAEEMILDVVRLLVKNGAEVDAADSYDRTPLFIAVERGYLSVVEYLLNLGADANGYGKSLTILEAVFNKDLDVLECLVNCGAKLNVRDRKGDGLLKIVVDYVKDEDLRYIFLKFLLDQGVDVNDADKSGDTLLHVALEREDSKLFRFLVDSNANVHARNVGGESPMRVAIKRNLCDEVKLLLDKSPKENALMLAFECENESMMKFLLRNGVKDEDGEVAMRVTESESIKILELMDRYRAIVDTDGEIGKKIFVAAIRSRKIVAVQYWFDRGADVEVEHEAGRLPLEHALDDLASNSCLEARWTIETLVRHLAILESRGRAVSERNAKLIKADKDTNQYYENCLRELKKMQQVKVIAGVDTTYFDVLIKRNNSMTACLRCDLISNTLFATVINVDFLKSSFGFDFYCDDLKANFLHGLKRLIKVNEFNRVLRKIFESVLPLDVIRRIGDFYNDRDFGDCIGDNWL